LREIWPVAAPCCSTAAAMPAAISEICLMVPPIRLIEATEDCVADWMP